MLERLRSLQASVLGVNTHAANNVTLAAAPSGGTSTHAKAAAATADAPLPSIAAFFAPQRATRVPLPHHP
jgi:hypothetical protein